MDTKKERDHSAEYVDAHFRITCAYNGMQGWLSEESKLAFRDETTAMFEEVGWTIKKGEWHGSADTVHRRKESLYLHPQDFSGVIRKDTIPEIIILLRDRKTFSYKTVDLYNDFYDISDDDYLNRLIARKQEITDTLLELTTTKRRNLFVPASRVISALEGRFRLHRVGEKYGDLVLSNFLLEQVQVLLEEGKLVKAKIKSGEGLRAVKEK